MKHRNAAVICLLFLATCNLEEEREGGSGMMLSPAVALSTVPPSEVATWQRVGATSVPDGRFLMAAAFDEDRKVFVMFGGAVMQSTRKAAPNQETWEWNPADGRWTNRTRSGRTPAARSGAAMVYDPEAKRFMMFGGRAASGYNYEDTWLWDPESGVWMDVTYAGHHPPVRGQHGMVYERSTKKVLLFGGARGDADYITGGEVSVSLGDAWEWDPGLNVWSAISVTGGPSARHDFGMVWDSARNKVVLFGGMSTDIPGATGATKQDIWEWDPSAGVWTERTPAGEKPSPRYGHAMAYDPARAKIVVFGGWDIGSGGMLSDVWEWDGSEGTWNQRQSPSASGWPVERMYAGAIYDDYDASNPRIDLVAGAVPASSLLGGTGGGATTRDMISGCNQIWGFDPVAGTFTDRTVPSDIPIGRSEQSMAFNPATGTVYMFGGVDSHGQRMNDLWEFTGPAVMPSHAWKKLADGAAGPSPRSGAGLAYDPARKTMILFGGTDNSYGFGNVYNDTWEFNPVTQKWSLLKLDGKLPDGAYLHAMVTDTARNKILAFGGYSSDRSTTNKVWEWDGAALTWTHRSPASSAAAPSGRAAPTAAFDEGRGKLFVFDGSNFHSPELSSSTFWEWDPVSQGWELRDTGDELAGSIYNFAAYDSVRRREVILTNGYDSSGLLQTLEMDARYPVWYVRALPDTPGDRYHATMVYDKKRNVIVLFGGVSRDGAYLNETWEYSVTGWGNGTGCTSATAASCASGYCVEGVCCAEAACTGACKSCNSPKLEGKCVVASAGTEVTGSCSSGQACDGSGNCKSKNGQPCGEASSCATGFCVDGVCCDSPCDAKCSSCGIAGRVGKCSPYTSGTDPQGECEGSGVCKSTCDGAGHCAFPRENLSCGACQTCDGAGTCSLVDQACFGGAIGPRGGMGGYVPLAGAGGAIGPRAGAGGSPRPGGAGGAIVPRAGAGGSLPFAGAGGGRAGAGGSGGSTTGRGGAGGATTAFAGAGGHTAPAGGAGGASFNVGGSGGKADGGSLPGGSSGKAIIDGGPEGPGSARLRNAGCSCAVGRAPSAQRLMTMPWLAVAASLFLWLRRRRK